MSGENREHAAEESVNQLINHLEGKEHAHDVRNHKYTVDFTIGNPELWPSSMRDGEIRAIRSSSVSFGGMQPYRNGKAVQGNPQTGSNIHLPPARAELWDELESEAGFSDKFALVNGTFELGGLLPPPDGICTPHLIIVEDASVDEVIDALDEAFGLYEAVYDSGSLVIKEKPE